MRINGAWTHFARVPVSHHFYYKEGSQVLSNANIWCTVRVNIHRFACKFIELPKLLAIKLNYFSLAFVLEVSPSWSPNSTCLCREIHLCTNEYKSQVTAGQYTWSRQFWLLSRSCLCCGPMINSAREAISRGEISSEWYLISGGCQIKVTSFWWLCWAFWDD